MASRIPVTVVMGGSRSGKSRLIRQLRAASPPGERWAWLDNSVGNLQDDSMDRADPAGRTGAVAAGQYFQLAGGCACCVAGAAFRVTLVRLLRAGPWDGLHIEVDPAGHGHALVDQLRSAPFDQYLEVCQLPVTVLPAEAEQYRAANGLLEPLSRLETASDILVRAATDDGGLSAPAFEAWLQAAPPWPRLAAAAQPRPARAGSLRAADLPGWRVFTLAEPAGTQSVPDLNPVVLSADGRAGCLIRRWPAEAIGQRREMKALMEASVEALAEAGDVLGFQALLRTPRAWYRWAFGRGSGVAGAPDFNVGPRLVESESAWRLDNRLCLWLRPDVLRLRNSPAPVAAILRALDASLSLAGSDGVGSLGAGGRQ